MLCLELLRLSTDWSRFASGHSLSSTAASSSVLSGPATHQNHSDHRVTELLPSLQTHQRHRTNNLCAGCSRCKVFWCCQLPEDVCCVSVGVLQWPCRLRPRLEVLQKNHGLRWVIMIQPVLLLYPFWISLLLAEAVWTGPKFQRLLF